jgi:hypothetical protein
MKDYTTIALVFHANDYAHLACAIDEAEAHQLVPHAARVRVVAR